MITERLVALRVTLVCLLVAALPAAADIPGFALQVVNTRAGAETDVRALTAAADGKVWYVDERYTPHHVASIAPGGQINRYPIPCDQCDQHTRLAYVEDIVAGPDGNLWMIGTHVGSDGSPIANGDNNYVWRMTPEGSFTAFKVPTVNAFRRFFLDDAGGQITRGPDGNLWFTERPGNKIGRITPGGEITEFTLPTGFSNPLFIVSGPDGNLWFTETRGAIGKITPQGSLTEYRVTTPSSPHGITVGADGNLWFVDYRQGVGRITPSGAITLFALPFGSADTRPYDITAAADGNLYLTFWTRESATAPAIPRIGQIVLSKLGTTLVRDQSFRDQAVPREGLLNFVYIVPAQPGVSAADEGDITFYLNGVINNLKHELYRLVIEAECPPVSMAPSPLPNGLLGTPYSVTATVSGGNPPLVVQVVSGSVPGLVIEAASGTVHFSGTPTAPGRHVVVLRVTDAKGCVTVLTTDVYIETPPACEPVVIRTNELDHAKKNQLYSAELQAIGGKPPLRFSIADGEIPAGFSLTPDGGLSGTTAEQGQYDFLLKVTDSSDPACSATKWLRLIVCGDISLFPETLPGRMKVGESFGQIITASGGSLPYSFLVFDGSLPDGMALGLDGTLAGKPTKSGDFDFTVKAYDSYRPPCNGARRYSGYVCPKIAIAPSLKGSGLIGTPLEVSFTASNGTPPFQFATTGFVPPGLSAQTGADSLTLAGVPTEVGTYRISVTVTDAKGCKDTLDYQINVRPVKAPQSKENKPKSGEAGDPVNTATGELYFLEKPDLILRGPMPLFFARYYASSLAADGRSSSALGENWLHNYDFALTRAAADRVRVLTSRGRVVEFQGDPARWRLVTASHVPYQLVSEGDRFVFGDPSISRAYSFDADGRLISVEDGKGNRHELTWSADRLTGIADGLGRSLALEYDSAGLLRRLSDGRRNVTFVHTGRQLTSVTNAIGNTITYQYDSPSAALLTSRVMPEGNVYWSQRYDGESRVVSQTSGAGNTTTFEYHEGRTVIRDAQGATREHRHAGSDASELVSASDEAGKTSVVSYDAQGNISSVTDRMGDVLTMRTAAESGRLVEFTAPDQAGVSLSWTPRVFRGVTFHDFASVRYPDGTSESFVHDERGNVTTRIDRAGRTWAYTWNDRGLMLTATSPAGGRTTMTYNDDGTLRSVTEPDLEAATFVYDDLGRLSSLRHPDGSSFVLGYDDADRLLTITDAVGSVSTFQYDRNDNLVAVTDAMGGQVRNSYDALDRLVGHTDRAGAVTRVHYDSREQISGMTDADGRVWTLGYDSRHRLTSFTNPLGHVSRYTSNDEGVPSSFTDALGHTTTLTTDKLGQLVEMKNALGHTTRYTRDPMQRVTSVTDPLGRTTSYAYDSLGLLRSMTMPGGQSAEYGVNELGLLSSLRDPNGQTWALSYTAGGRLARSTDPLGRTTSTSYDRRGERSRVSFADGGSVTFERDAAGNLTRASYSDGPDLRFSYDALHRLTGADGVRLTRDDVRRTAATEAHGQLFEATYDVAGRLVKATYEGGRFSVMYEYDAADRLVAVEDSLTGSRVRFSYDDANRLTSIRRPNGVDTVYTYDAANRITRIQHGQRIQIRLSLSAAGEVLAEDRSGLPPAIVSEDSTLFTYDAASQIDGPGYASDARGRVTQLRGLVLRWDGASRLLSAGGVSYTYDGMSRLSSRTENGQTTTFFYNNAIARFAPVAERLGAAFTRYYVRLPRGNLLYMIEANGNAVSYFHFDRTGSTVALSNSSGAVTDTWTYEPYGSVLGRTGRSSQPYAFVGEHGVRYDAATGLHLMGMRWYDATTARFLSRDPLKSLDPRNLNPYAYAGNDPLTFIDPEGLLFLKWDSKWGGEKPDSFDKTPETNEDIAEAVNDELGSWSDVGGYFADGVKTAEALSKPVETVKGVKDVLWKNPWTETLKDALVPAGEVAEVAKVGKWSKVLKVAETVGNVADAIGAASSGFQEGSEAWNADIGWYDALRTGVNAAALNYGNSVALGPIGAIDTFFGNYIQDNLQNTQMMVVHSGLLLEDMLLGRASKKQMDFWRKKAKKAAGGEFNWGEGKVSVYSLGEQAADGNLSWVVDVAQWGFEMQDWLFSKSPKPKVKHP